MPQQILEELDIAVIDCEPDATIREVNAPALRLLGGDASGVVGAPLPSLLQFSPELTVPGGDNLGARKKHRGKYRLLQGGHTLASQVQVLVDDGDHPDGYRVSFVAPDSFSTGLNAMEQAFLESMESEIHVPAGNVLRLTQDLVASGLGFEHEGLALELVEQASDLQKVLSRYVDFAKLEQGQLDLIEVDFDIRTTIEDVVSAEAASARLRGMTLSHVVHADVPNLVRGDATRLRQVLAELLRSSIEGSPGCELTLVLGLAALEKTRCSLRFEIREAGADDETDEAEGEHAVTGWGFLSSRAPRLELGICQRLIECMGGELSFQHERENPVIFTFTASYGIAEEKARGKQETTTQNLSGKRVLIADPDASVQEEMKQIAKSWGMSAYGASTEEELLEALRMSCRSEQAIDIVVLDLELGGKPSWNIASTIKDDKSFGKPALMLLPSHSERGHAVRAKKSGFLAYIPKPLPQAMLQEGFLRVLHLKAEGSKELVTRYSLADERAEQKTYALLVEDSKLNQRAGAKLLEKLGCRVDIASNGEEAVTACRSRSYDIVFMDCNMPILDGYEASKQIRELESSARDVPIVAMTANDAESDRLACLEVGMDDFLPKPAPPDKIQAMLVKWTKRTDMARS